jgi:uncharacterized membrane protein YbhN (UPF0104 family)
LAQVLSGRRLRLTAKIFGTGLAVAILIRMADIDVLTGLLRQADLPLLALGGVGIIAQTALSAAKWQVLLRLLDVRKRFGYLMRTYLIANFVNLFTPSFVGGDAYRSASVWRGGETATNAISSVLADRLTGLLALFLIAATGFAAYADTLTALFVPAGLAIASVAYWAALMSPLFEWLEARAPRRLAWIVSLMGELRTLLRPSPSLPTIMGISLLFQFNTIVIISFYARGMHLDVTFSQLLWIVPMVALLELIPITINGLGLREGGYAFAFHFLGLPPEQGIVLGLTISVMRYVVSSTGGLLLLLSRERLIAVPQAGKRLSL